MFVLKPAARRASCVWSKLSLRAALRENNGRSSMFLAFSSGGVKTIMAAGRSNASRFIAVGSECDGEKKKTKNFQFNFLLLSKAHGEKTKEGQLNSETGQRE